MRRSDGQLHKEGRGWEFGQKSNGSYGEGQWKRGWRASGKMGCYMADKCTNVRVETKGERERRGEKLTHADSHSRTS